MHLRDDPRSGGVRDGETEAIGFRVGARCSRSSLDVGSSAASAAPSTSASSAASVAASASASPAPSERQSASAPAPSTSAAAPASSPAVPATAVGPIGSSPTPTPTTNPGPPDDESEKTPGCARLCTTLADAQASFQSASATVWKDLYQLDIPVLGIKVGSDDLALLGTMGLLVLAVWSWFTHRREWASSVAVNTLARRLFVRQSHALLAKLHHAVVSELVFAPVRIGAPLPQTPTGLRRIVAWLFLLTLLLGGAVLLMAKGWGAAPPADGAVAAEYTWRVGGIILVVILVVLLGLGKLLRGILCGFRKLCGPHSGNSAAG